LLSDTVGFIRDLPHHLIASFKATLEETRQADLLLHVADASSPNVAQQISDVYKVLEELGIQQKDTLLLLNKIDALASRSTLDSLLARYPGAIAVSARTREGFDHLADVVSATLSRSFHDIVIETGVENGRLMAYLNSNAEVLSTKFDGLRASIHCRISAEALGRINDPTASILVTNGHVSSGNGREDSTVRSAGANHAEPAPHPQNHG
jgi:GTP-binding protein HflX